MERSFAFMTIFSVSAFREFQLPVSDVETSGEVIVIIDGGLLTYKKEARSLPRSDQEANRCQ